MKKNEDILEKQQHQSQTYLSAPWHTSYALLDFLLAQKSTDNSVKELNKNAQEFCEVQNKHI